MADQTYDDGRAQKLRQLLRTLGARITELDADGDMLHRAGELMKLIGDVRSELFHYEVRATYDTPEIAESRRIVAEARQADDTTWPGGDWVSDNEDDRRW